MSSARRLQEDYRRIIGLQDETRGLDDDLPRMRIGGQRGVWQIGNNELKTGDAGGEDEDGNTVDPVTPDEGEDNQNDDGSGGGGGGTDPSNPLEPEIIDPENPPESGADVTDSTFGGGWATGGAKSFVDCETGQCIELVEVGGYIDPAGYDGQWDENDIPTGFDQAIPQSIIDNIDNYLPPVKGREWYAQPIGVVPRTSTAGAQMKLHSAPNGWWASKVSWGYQFYRVGGGIGFRVTSRACVSGVPNNPPSCAVDFIPPEIPPAPWPADGCIQLAPNSEGNWAASDKENPADMTAKYSEPKSQLTLCTPSGETVEIYNRVGGGHVYFNSDQGIWAGSDSSGRIRSFGSTSTLNQEIARPRN